MSVAPRSENEPWYGVWPGTVVNANDPERRGRLRVRLDQVYGNVLADEQIEDDFLPWAEACFPVPGIGSGFLWVPPVGASVLVAFCQGDPERPIWLGGWISNVDHTPEFYGAYQSLGPKTAVFKTDGGHLFEMRWFEGQSKIQLVSQFGNKIVMTDSLAGGGPSIEISTPLGNSLVLNDALGRVSLTAVQDAQISAVGNFAETVTGLTTKTYLGVFAATFLLAATFTALGLLSLVGTGIILATTGGAIALGSQAGTKQALVLQNFITDIFNLHTHSVSGVQSGSDSVVSGVSILQGDVGTHATQNVVAD